MEMTSMYGPQSLYPGGLYRALVGPHYRRIRPALTNIGSISLAAYSPEVWAKDCVAFSSGISNQNPTLCGIGIPDREILCGCI